MQNSFEQAKKFIDDHGSFLLATHQRTDGDDCGSMLAMTQVLKNMGKVAVPMALGGVPPTLKFLPLQSEVVESVPESQNFSALILFGCSSLDRTGLETQINPSIPILNIDHHRDNKNFGQINVVDPDKSSVAELVYDFFKYCGFELNADISKCLLTGIFTDTGSFMHANTTASALHAAGELMKFGAPISKIHSFTYKNKDLDSLKAWSKAIEKTKIDPANKIAICVLTQEDMDQIGKVPEDAFAGFVETLNTLPNTKFAMFIRQDGEFIKGSLRSDEFKKTDVSQIAKMFGGGGHKLASAFRIKGKILRMPNGSWDVVAS